MLVVCWSDVRNPGWVAQSPRGDPGGGSCQWGDESARLRIGGLVMDLRDFLQRDVADMTEQGRRPRVAAHVPAGAVVLWG